MYLPVQQTFCPRYLDMTVTARGISVNHALLVTHLNQHKHVCVRAKDTVTHARSAAEELKCKRLGI